MHHRVHADQIVRIGSVESKGLDIIEDDVPLSGLVEHELDDLGTILADPPLCDLC